MASSHPSNETYSLNKEELGNTSSSPRASVISIPELFTYALYIVIAFVLEVLYLAITLLLALLTNSKAKRSYQQLLSDSTVHQKIKEEKVQEKVANTKQVDDETHTKQGKYAKDNSDWLHPRKPMKVSLLHLQT